MSSEGDRSRKGEARKCATVSPEAASDSSTMQNVFDFLQDYVPQYLSQFFKAVSGPKEERRERVLWARFEVGDANDLSLPHLAEAQREGGRHGHVPLPLLLTLGLCNGYSIWAITPGGDAREVYYSYGEGETARVVRLLRTPERTEGVAPDAFADKRPLIAVVKKGRHSLTGSTVAYSSLHVVSLRAEEEGGGGNVIKKCVFKTRPIVDVQCNRRVVAVVFQKRIVLLSASSLETRMVIKNNYPSSAFPCNPIALGSRWMAYSETKLSSKQQSIGGMSHTTTPTMATTMLKNVRKGISALTETISGLTAKAQGTSLEANDRTQQEAPVSCAHVITVVDTAKELRELPQQELRVQDLGKENALVAHFVAHAGSDVHIAGLAFNPSGHLLLSATTEGHAFHVFQLLPHPFLCSETAVHHLYTLYRGATSGLVQDISFSSDSRWVVVSTLNGTSHVFPISPYGGDPSVRTHTATRVVNKMSRFHTSAGMDSIADQYHHFHNSVPNTKNSIASKTSQSHMQLSQSSPPLPVSAGSGGGRDHSASIPSFMNGYNSWSNPRSLPLPTPVSVSALQQIKQPYQSSTVAVGGISRGSGSRSGEGVSPSSSGSRLEASSGGSGEPYVTLAGPDAVCVQAIFWEPSDSGQGGLNSKESGASYSLYVLGGSGVLVEHHLQPQKLLSAPDGEDAPIELSHYSKLCWRLMGSPPAAVPPGSLQLPLPEDNPLIMAYQLYEKFSMNDNESEHHSGGRNNFISSTSSFSNPSTTTTTTSSSSSSADDKWLSQVEILTHAQPSRRLWMGPQFSFRPCHGHTNFTSSPGVSNSLSTADLIKTPSPPNTIIYSGSLNSSISAQQVLTGSRMGVGGDGSAVLFPSAESPLLDILAEESETGFRSANSSPVNVPRSVGHRREGAGGGEVGQKAGMLEVFGSWNKVAPHYEGGPFDNELERQLQDAMGEQDAITIVARDTSVRTGFSPLAHESATLHSQVSQDSNFHRLLQAIHQSCHKTFLLSFILIFKA